MDNEKLNIEIMETFDALGNPIKIGELYGASRNSNGITRITVGVAEKLNLPGKVRLRVTNHKWAVYCDAPKDRKFDKGSVSIYASGLFPINKKDL